MILKKTNRTMTIDASRARNLILSLLGVAFVLLAICPIPAFACDVYDVDMWLGPDTTSAEAHMTLDFDTCTVTTIGWHVHFDAYGPDNSGFNFKVEDLTSPQTMQNNDDSPDPDDRSASGNAWWSPIVAGGTKTIRVDVRRSGDPWYTSGNTRTSTVVRVLDVTVSPSQECVDTDVTFTVVTAPASGHASLIEWTASSSGTPDPATGSGTQTFDTQWDTPGLKYASAKCEGRECIGCNDSGSVTIKGVSAVYADEATPCEDENVTFTAITFPTGNEGSVTWSGGGTPSTGSGATFTTKWTTGSTGTRTVTATYCGHEEQESVYVFMDCDCTKPEADWQPITSLSLCDTYTGPEGDRWPFTSPPEYDDCENWFKIVCEEVGTIYEYRDYYNDDCIGACIYVPANNDMKYRHTFNGERWHSIKHATFNDCKDGGINDYGTKDEYDWQIWKYNCLTESQQTSVCRESATKPNPLSTIWIESTGESSSCDRSTPCP